MSASVATTRDAASRRACWKYDEARHTSFHNAASDDVVDDDVVDDDDARGDVGGDDDRGAMGESAFISVNYGGIL